MPTPLSLLNRRSGTRTEGAARASLPAQTDGGSAAAPRPGRRPRLYALDGMRLIAALGVLLFHYTGQELDPRVWHGSNKTLLPHVHEIGRYTWMGVELFFLISGFVICMSCWGKRPRDFFISRVIRLYPAYWFCVLLTAAVVWYAARPFGSFGDLSARTLFSNLSMMQWPIGSPAVDPVYWTLWLEMRFYVAFAIVVAFGLTYRRVVLFCMIWSFAAIFTPMINFGLATEVTQPVYAPFFIGGIVMYLMYRFKPTFLLWAMLVFDWMMAQNQLPGIMKQYESDGNRGLTYTVACLVMTACYLLVLAAALGKLNWISWKWLTTAGALTYPLYLLHQEIGWVGISYLRRSLPPGETLGAMIAIMLVVAYLVNRVVERPLSAKLKTWLESSFKAMAEASDAK